MARDSDTNELLAFSQQFVRSIGQNIADGSLKSKSNLEYSLVKDYGFDDATARAVATATFRYIMQRCFPPITRLELFLTENCPLRCDYCFVCEKENQNRMSFEVARAAIDFLILESRDKQRLEVLFFGGEPLVEYKLIKQVVHYAELKAKDCEKQIHFDMTTNGILFTNESLIFCRDHGIKFLVSIDGDRDSHDKHRRTFSGEGSFDILDAKLPMMKSYQPWLGARMTIHPDTLARLAQNVEFLVRKGINQFIISPVEGVDWPEESLLAYERELVKVISFYEEQKALGTPIRITFFEEAEDGDFFKKGWMWGCRAGRYSLTISPEGEILPCSKMIGPPDLKRLCRLGTLEEGITNLALRLQLTGLIPTEREKCMACEFAKSCTGGCFALNYLETGNLFNPGDFTCKFAKISNRVAHYISDGKQQL